MTPVRNLAFSLYQLRQLLRVQGTDYIVLRDEVDSFEEPTVESAQVVTLRGLWHTTNEYITTTTDDGSTVRSKENPRILSLWQDAKKVQQKDFVQVNGIRFNVNGVENVGELGVAAEISLEAVV